MNDRIKKLRKRSKLAASNTLGKVDIVKRETATTPVMGANIAFNGDVDMGLDPGMLMMAGPSRHFKTNFGLLAVASWLNKYPDAVCLFYDSEFGASEKYFASQGIDPERVLHCPIKDIEELKFDIMGQLSELTKEDNIIIFIDSIGNLASKKEVEDAINDNSAADMTRAKQLKSLWRMVTPYLKLYGIPLIAINHVYNGMGSPVATVGGGQGGILSSDDIWIIGRQQEKDGSDVIGYHFIINIEKSRKVKEKSKIPVFVTFEGGIQTHYTLFEVAKDAGYLVKNGNGWYSFVDMETGEVEEKRYRKKDLYGPEVWEDENRITERFKEWIRKRYQLESKALIAARQMEEEDAEAIE